MWMHRGFVQTNITVGPHSSMSHQAPALNEQSHSIASRAPTIPTRLSSAYSAHNDTTCCMQISQVQQQSRSTMANFIDLLMAHFAPSCVPLDRLTKQVMLATISVQPTQGSFTLLVVCLNRPDLLSENMPQSAVPQALCPGPVCACDVSSTAMRICNLPGLRLEEKDGLHHHHTPPPPPPRLPPPRRHRAPDMRKVLQACLCFCRRWGHHRQSTADHPHK